MNAVAQARSSHEREYRQKLCSPAEAASLVKSGDHLCFPLFAGEPTLFVKALAARKRELEGVVVKQQPRSPTRTSGASCARRPGR